MAVKTLSGALLIAVMILLLIACMAEFGSAQTTGALLPALPPTFFSVSGVPAANAKVCTLAAGTTTTWRATYSDSALSMPLPNPITLNSIGIPTTNGNTQSAIYILPLAYKIILYAAGTGNTCNGTAVGSVIWTRDNVYDVGDLLRSQIAAGTAIVAIPSYTFAGLPTAGTGGRLARVTDQQGGLWMDSGSKWVKVPSSINPLDAPFNAKCDGSTNDTTAFSTANIALSTNGGDLVIPSGKVCILHTITFAAKVNVVFQSGAQFSVPSMNTVTFSGPVTAPVQQIFAGAGTVTISSSFIPAIYPEWRGALADGTTDSTAGLNWAFTQTNQKVMLANGNYLFASNLSVPTCASIEGVATINPNNSTGGTLLTAGASVTKAMSLTDVSPQYLSNFILNGAATSGATGIVVGDGAIWSGTLNAVIANNFAGAGGVGIQAADIVQGMFINVHANLSDTSMLLQTISGSTPTTLTIVGGSIRTATHKGLKIINGFGIKFIGTTFESNGEEGVYLDTSSGSVIIDVEFIGCWWENNYGSDTSNYQFTANGSGDRNAFKILGGFFNQSNMSAKPIHITGAAATFTIDNPQFPSSPVITAGILVDVGALGHCDFPANFNPAVIVSTASGGTCYNVNQNQQAEEAAWTAWTPTLSSTAGNFATTYTGSPSITVARYKQIGKTLCINLAYKNTLNAVTPGALYASPPLGLAAVNSAYNNLAAVIVNNNANEAGIAQIFQASDLSYIAFERLNGSNFTSATIVGGTITGCYEVN